MPGLKELRVLVVDDNAQMRALIRSILRGASIGHVVEATGVDDGIAILRLQSIDIVLVDLAMKPLDGIEFAKRVRRIGMSPNPYLAMIMMTCHSHQSRVAAARDAGVNSFLAKPISGRSLIEHILGVVNDGRPFIRGGPYFGPDRRRLALAHYTGPKRRAGEVDMSEGIDLDDVAPGPAIARAS